MLSVIVGLIGVANMVNTVTTDVMARKVEYAAMQSIGMTGRQMKRDIFEKYAGLVGVALGLATAVGAVLAYTVGERPGFNFSAGAFVQAFAIFVGISAGLCVVMSQVLAWEMNRKSIVERLREVV
jgi:ABC-type antimicrobial peptide transport system permease subunit